MIPLWSCKLLILQLQIWSVAREIRTSNLSVEFTCSSPSVSPTISWFEMFAPEPRFCFTQHFPSKLRTPHMVSVNLVNLTELRRFLKRCLDYPSTNHINEFISEWVFRKWGLAGWSGSWDWDPGKYIWSRPLRLWLFSALQLPSFYEVSCFALLPCFCLSQANHGLTPLKLWVKVNSSSLKLQMSSICPELRTAN